MQTPVPGRVPRRPRLRAYAGSFHGLLVVFGALWLAIGAGLSLGILAADTGLEDRVVLAWRGVTTTARPVAVLPTTNDSTSEIRLRFQDRTGKTIFGSCYASQERLLRRAKTGSPLPVRYDPRRPERFRVLGARASGLDGFAVLGALVAAAGTALLGIGLAGALRRRRLFVWGAATTGVVVSLEPSPGRFLSRTIMKVRYAFQGPAGEVVATVHDAEWPPEGADVTVLYDPRRPRRSVLVAAGAFESP